MTLVEIMMSFGIFAFAATAVVAGLIQSQKISNSNLAESYAGAMAQGILEEVVRVPPARLADSSESSISIKVATLTDTNYTSIDDFTLPWAADDTTYTEIGTTADGILTDAAYIAEGNQIRPERFMKMRINLRRTIESTDNRVLIVLRFQWEDPNRTNTDGTPIYHTGELRTVRSTALRF